MSWTVACFCGTVFTAPAERCPTCATRVPAVTRGTSPADSTQLPDAIEEPISVRDLVESIQIRPPSRRPSC